MTERKKLWITYSWKDNENQEVDFIAQELEKLGIEVKLDRWNIKAGGRLWEQIENFICNKNESDAWAIFLTPASLKSEPCNEELAYAIDRALNGRDQAFPIIGILPSRLNYEALPASIRTRLYVSLLDSDWRERLISGINNSAPKVSRPLVQPFSYKFHRLDVPGIKKDVLEIWLKAGVWSPSFVAIPIDEKEKVNPRFKYGPRGVYNQGSQTYNIVEGPSEDGEYYIMSASNEVSSSQSLFLLFDKHPSNVKFGVYGKNWWRITIEKEF